MLDYRNPHGDRGSSALGRTAKSIVLATAVAGALDILSAFMFGAMAGTEPGLILRYIASGPFGDGMRAGGAAASMLGLIVHFALMAIFVAIFATLSARLAAVRRHWIVAGAIYGIAVYFVMYWLVVPARFGSVPSTDPWQVAQAWFSHILCVGLPISFIMARHGGIRAPRESRVAPQGDLISGQPAG